MENDYNYEQNMVEETEQYSFSYTSEEILKIFNRTFKNNKIRSVLLLVLYILCAVGLYFIDLLPVSIAMLAIGFGFFITQISNINTTKQQWKNAGLAEGAEHIYHLTKDKIIVDVIRNGVLEEKNTIDYNKIDYIINDSDYIIFQYELHIYFLRKADINPNSILYAKSQIIHNKISKKSKYKLIGAVIAGISLFICIQSQNIIYSANQYFFKPSYWIYFLLAIPAVISVIYGVFLIRKKIPFWINLIAGLIMSALLIFGGFEQLNYLNYFGYANDILSATEEKINIDIPKPDNIDFYSSISDSYHETVYSEQLSDSKILYETYLYFDQSEADEFEQTLADCNNVIENLSEIDLIYPYNTDDFDYCNEYYDCFILYNVDTGEFNSVTTEKGEHRFVFLAYSYEYDELDIIEYLIKL